MPSGHGSTGGGGSHFGGGGSSGGSHFGGGSSSGHIGGGRSVVIIGGHRHYYGGGGGTLSSIAVYIFFLVFVAFWIFGGALIINSANKDINYIKEDRAYYLNMIDTGYRTTGTVTGVYYNYDRYYITYRFSPKIGVTMIGESFCVYKDKLSAPSYNSEITIAYDAKTSNADSIPVDYVNYKLSDDGEYLNIKSGRNAGVIMVVIASSIELLVLVLMIRAIKKRKKTETEPVKSTLNQTSEKPKETRKVCAYCGTTISSNSNKCPNCGATQHTVEK